MMASSGEGEGSSMEAHIAMLIGYGMGEDEHCEKQLAEYVALREKIVKVRSRVDVGRRLNETARLSNAMTLEKAKESANDANAIVANFAQFEKSANSRLNEVVVQSVAMQGGFAGALRDYKRKLRAVEDITRKHEKNIANVYGETEAHKVRIGELEGLNNDANYMNKKLPELCDHLVRTVVDKLSAEGCSLDDPLSPKDLERLFDKAVDAVMAVKAD